MSGKTWSVVEGWAGTWASSETLMHEHTSVSPRPSCPMQQRVAKAIVRRQRQLRSVAQEGLPLEVWIGARLVLKFGVVAWVKRSASPRGLVQYDFVRSVGGPFSHPNQGLLQSGGTLDVRLFWVGIVAHGQIVRLHVLQQPNGGPYVVRAHASVVSTVKGKALPVDVVDAQQIECFRGLDATFHAVPIGHKPHPHTTIVVSHHVGHANDIVVGVRACHQQIHGGIRV